MLRILLSTVCILITSCGGVSAGSNAGTDGGPSALLGERSVPAGRVTATTLTAIAPGQPAAFHLAVTDRYGITAVAVLLGSGYNNAFPLSVAEDDDGWVARGELPDPLPLDCGLLVRITDTAGGVQETASGDFPLVRR